MGTSSTRQRRAPITARAVVGWLLAPALLLGVIAMHAMVSAPTGHAEHVDHAVVAASVDTASADHATAMPPAEGGSADLGCGTVLMMCLAILLAVALVLRSAPARRWLARGRRAWSGGPVLRRSPFAVMPVLLSTSILRC